MLIPCISLHQPWASLVAVNEKTLETRGWAPPQQYIGQTIGIHAAKRKLQSKEINYYMSTAMTSHCTCTTDGWRANCGGFSCLPFGAVVATAVLAQVGQVVGYTQDERTAIVLPKYRLGDGPFLPKGVMPVAGEGESRLLVNIDHYGDFSEGRYLWFFDQIKKLDSPVEARGYQRFFRIDIEASLG